MEAWPVYGMYQPDAIKFYTHGGVDYIITANEGDSKDYPPFFSEEARVKDLTLSNDFERNQTIRDDLQEDAKLGRLTVTTENGKSPNSSEYDALYTFGGRSFTIRRADTMEIVYDSGDELERKTGLLLAEMFNNGVSPSKSATSTIDKRSDNKGPETESITLGHIGCASLLMIGNERPGTIAVYSIDERVTNVKPKFETIVFGVRTTIGTWEQLYDRRQISMIDPEDMKFVPAAESPNNQPLLLVSGSVSGTVSILQVLYECESNDDINDSNTGTYIATSSRLAVLMLLLAVAEVM